jgi:hypothetical protein
VAAIAFVDVDALHINAGVPLDVGDSGLEGMPVEGIVVKRLGVQDELTAFGLVTGVAIETLQPNSSGALAFPLPMHSTSGACSE